MAQATLFIYTETPTHAGTGAGLGAVDLPIQREQTTNYPIIQSSGVKGALRSQYRASNANDENEALIVFGPANAANGATLDYASAVAFGDARVLAFPVRSLKGVFAWVTCVDVLARFQRDCTLATVPQLLPRSPSTGNGANGQFYTEAFPSGNGALIGTLINNQQQYDVVLEEYAYRAVLPTVQNNQEIASSTQAYTWAKWLAANTLPTTNVYQGYYKEALQDRLIILPDDDFRDFTLYATQVVTRIALDRETKTVSGTALFTQELLPADTLLYVPVTTQKPRAKQTMLDATVYFRGSQTGTATDQTVLNWLKDTNKMPANARLQIGGDETIGRGFVALRWG